MESSRFEALRGQLDELDGQDRALAEMLAELTALTDEVHQLRHDAGETLAELASLPGERDNAEAERATARVDVVDAARAHALAEGALAELERARKPREEDIERARKDVAGAAAELHDATARAERADHRLVELDELELSLTRAADGLVEHARDVAARLQAAPRVTDAGKGAPGTSLRDLDEWGARARAALFVAHSTLAMERDRLIQEANSLGATALGVETGALSVALIRQRFDDPR